MTLVNKGIPATRHQQILNWLAEEGSLSIRELQNRLSVSHMTVHRDLDRLAEQGLLRKVHAGAIHSDKQEVPSKNQNACAMCAAEISKRSEFIIMREDERQVCTCCPHCGILLLSKIGVEESALARDYLYGKMVNVYQAAFVYAPEVRLCCVPTILCFASISDAEKFSHGFGGQVMNFSQALIRLTSSHITHISENMQIES